MPMGIELFYDGEIVFRPGEKTPIHLHHGITLPGKLPHAAAPKWQTCE